MQPKSKSGTRLTDASVGRVSSGTRLTDALVRRLEPPESGNKITYDSGGIPGFGVRTTAAGVKSFTLDYRTRSGRSRRIARLSPTMPPRCDDGSTATTNCARSG